MDIKLFAKETMIFVEMNRKNMHDFYYSFIHINIQFHAAWLYTFIYHRI